MPTSRIEKSPATVLEDGPSESELAPWQESLSRWSLLLCVLWVNFGIGWVWLVQASSEIQSYIFYGNITPVEFRLLNEIFLYVYIPIGPVGCYLIDKHFKLAIFISAATISAGSVLSYFAGDSYDLALAANILMALCQGTIFPAAGFMANRYFPEKLVQVIVVLPLFMNILGNGAAQWFPIFLMDDTHEDSVIHARFSTIHMMSMFACVPSLLLFIPFWLWPLKPRMSTKSDVKATEEYKILLVEHQTQVAEEKNLNIGWWKGTILTVMTRMPLTNLIIGAAAEGMWSTWLTVANSEMINFGYTDLFTGGINFALVMVGVILSLCLSWNMNTPKKMDLGLKVTSLLVTLCWTAFTLFKVLYGGNIFMYQSTVFTGCLLFYYFLMGTAYMSWIGLLFNSACVVCSPISEAISTGNVLILNNGLGYGSQELIGHLGITGWWVIVGLHMVAFLINMFWYETKPTIDVQHLELEMDNDSKVSNKEVLSIVGDVKRKLDRIA